MGYLMLVGSVGWNERWEIPAGHEDDVATQLRHVGTDTTGQLQLLDPVSEQPIELFLAWRHVAAAAIVPSSSPRPGLRGQYA